MRSCSLRFLPLLALSGIVAAGEAPVPTEDQGLVLHHRWRRARVDRVESGRGHQVLDAHASLTASYSCGNFDIVSSVTNSFSNAATSLQSSVMGAARGAIRVRCPLYVFSARRAGSVASCSRPMRRTSA